MEEKEFYLRAIDQVTARRDPSFVLEGGGERNRGRSREGDNDVINGAFWDVER